jgi:serine/threonine protein kinase
MAGLDIKVLGGCEILAILGEGGMGTVYKVRQIALDRLAALKVLPPHLAGDEDFIARFTREAAAAAQLSHPNIVQVYAAGMQDGLRYFVMEFVDGESVQQRLKRKGSIPADEALAICMYVIQGLDYAWRRSNLIHRDIKPDNIFLSKAGEVKLGDLGLAKSVSGPHSGLTLTGSYMGTPYFISPEQARALKGIDFRADIYSLGGALFHMVTGHLPYEPEEGDNALTLMFKHVNEPVPNIQQVWPECPASLARLITRMLQKQPDERFGSYDDLLAAMKSAAADLRNKPVSTASIKQRPAPQKKLVVNLATPSTPASPAGKKAKADTKPPAKSTAKLVLEDDGPSFGLIMVVTLLFLLVVGLFIWKPWRSNEDDDATPAPADTGAESTATVPLFPTATKAPPAQVRPQPQPALAGPAFVAEVSALPPEQQLARVIASLRRLNLDFDGRETHLITEAGVVELTLATETVHNLAPLAALRNLKRLRVASPYARGSKLADLTPLTGLSLTQLDGHASAVASLSPLAGMPLEELDVHGCLKLWDLTALKGMKLRRLDISGCLAIVDFSFLQGLPLENLACTRARLTDLTFVKDAPLRTLDCDPALLATASQLEILHGLKTLEQINGKPAADVLSNPPAPAATSAPAPLPPATKPPRRD